MSTKSKAIKGVMWSAIEQFASQGIAFVLGIIIARIVMPSEYGLIAMLGIFMAVAQTFIDSGFSNAIVQKHDRNETDYSTVFYFNIAVSIVVFLGLFFSAPLIADYYNQPQLEAVTKVIALNLIILAFAVVPRAKLTVMVDFKSQTKASVSAALISGTIGIILAYQGWGVWALVAQSLCNNTVNMIILWIYCKWWPKLIFSVKSFKQLFAFGSKLLFSGLLDTIFRNLYLLVIGKKFAATELGYYSRANQLAEFPSSNISRIIGRVAFPIMCEMQHDDAMLGNALKKFIKLSVFITFPLMIGLAALAEPFISFVLTDKWIEAAPFLQALCISYMFYPVHGLNLTALQAKGRTDLFLKLEIYKKTLSVVILFATVPFGVYVMCLGLIGGTLACLPINLYYTKKLLHIGFYEQMKYIIPSFLLASMMGIIVYLLTLLDINNGLILLFGIIVGVVFYYIAALIFKLDELKELRDILGKKIPIFKNK